MSALGANISSRLNATVLSSSRHPDSGGFLDSCSHHCFWGSQIDLFSSIRIGEPVFFFVIAFCVCPEPVLRNQRSHRKQPIQKRLVSADGDYVMTAFAKWCARLNYSLRAQQSAHSHTIVAVATCDPL